MCLGPIMSIFLLFLGLLPIILMPDAFGGEEDNTGNGTGGGETDVLLPDDDDDTPPTSPIDFDPDTVLLPDDDDDTPSGYGGPVVGPVLHPITSSDGDFPADEDSTFLQHLLREQSDTTETLDTELGGGNDTITLNDDSIDSNGEGALGSWDGTPIIQTDGGLNIIDAGNEDGTITTGDACAYAFGGDENDTFWLYQNSGVGVGHAEIADFIIGEDFLRISLNPDTIGPTPSISVQPSNDGLDGVVTINGEIVAVLQGIPGASSADIYVDMPENIFR